MVAMGEDPDTIECPEPDVPPDLHWVWRSWWRLNASRTWVGGGMGAPSPAPIAFRDLVLWGEYHGYDGDMMHMLDHCTRGMDEVYIADVQKRQSK